jgi:predicted acylesterase/phospholipase RssA
MTSLAEQITGKRVGVALASGFFGFYHQTGVLKALEEVGIKPVRLTGTSAGALVGSMYAAGLSPDETSEVLLGLKREDFWDMHWPFTRLGFGLLGGHGFRAELANALPVHSFEECETPFTAAVYNLDSGRVEYINAGPIIPAVYASSCYPYLFTPIEIGENRYWDGGFGEKTALVPFLEEPEVDVVITSYMPLHGGSKASKSGLFSFLPNFTELFADIPAEERRERDRVSCNLLREAGKRVLVVAPKPIKLGPFSMDRGRAAFEQGRAGTLKILESHDEELLGHHDLR